MQALFSKYKNYITFFILLLILISIKIANPSFVKSISFISFDLYQKIFPLEKNETEVVIIDIDENLRPENLSVSNYCDLAKLIN